MVLTPAITIVTDASSMVIERIAYVQAILRHDLADCHRQAVALSGIIPVRNGMNHKQMSL